MAIINALMPCGYDPEEDENGNYIRDIDIEYTVVYREDDHLKEMYFTVYDDEDDVMFDRALKFAQNKDTVLFYSAPFGDYFDPRDGKIVRTPEHSGKDYYAHPMMPRDRAGFTAIDIDDLPF